MIQIQSGARGVLAAVAIPGADAAVGAYQYAGQIPSPAGHWTRQLMAQKLERTVAFRLCAYPFRASKIIHSIRGAGRADVCAPERARRLKSSFAPSFNLLCITRPRQSELFVRNSENALKQRALRKTH